MLKNTEMSISITKFNPPLNKRRLVGDEVPPTYFVV